MAKKRVDWNAVYLGFLCGDDIEELSKKYDFSMAYWRNKKAKQWRADRNIFETKVTEQTIESLSKKKSDKEVQLLKLYDSSMEVITKMTLENLNSKDKDGKRFLKAKLLKISSEILEINRKARYEINFIYTKEDKKIAGVLKDTKINVTIKSV